MQTIRSAKKFSSVWRKIKDNLWERQRDVTKFIKYGINVCGGFVRCVTLFWELFDMFKMYGKKETIELKSWDNVTTLMNSPQALINWLLFSHSRATFALYQFRIYSTDERKFIAIDITEIIPSTHKLSSLNGNRALCTTTLCYVYQTERHMCDTAFHFDSLTLKSCDGIFFKAFSR